MSIIYEDHVTLDWSNDAENSALITEINYILKYIQYSNRTVILNSKQIVKYCIYCILDQINAGLVKRKNHR